MPTQRPIIIGVDLDAVTADYYGGFRTFLTNKYNLSPSEAARRYPDPDTFTMANWEGFPANFLEEHQEAVIDGLYSKLPAMPGASKTLWQLSEEGYHLRIITSRFVAKGQHGTVIAQTGHWLDEYDIPYHDIMFVRDKTDVFANVYLDDSPQKIEAFQKMGCEVIIFDTLYNRQFEGRRAHTWSEAYAHITELNGALFRSQ